MPACFPQCRRHDPIRYPGLLRRRHPRAPRRQHRGHHPGAYHQGPVSLDAGAHDIAGDAWVPNAYLIVPLNEQWRLGLAATSYYGLGVKMPDNYNAGHFGNVSDIKTVDLGVLLAYRINRIWSVRAGLSAIQGKGGWHFSSNNQIAKHLKGDGWAMGWNLGTLLELSQATRIGLSYRHDVT